MNRSDTIGELAGALATAQGEMEGAKKDSQNPYFKSSYADLASVWEACRVPLSKNGLSIAQTTQSAEGESKGVVVETILMHKSGEWISGTLFMPCSKFDAQSYGSALTYARRYALQSMVGIAPVDDDAEGSMARGKEQHPQQPANANASARQATATKNPEVVQFMKSIQDSLVKVWPGKSEADTKAKVGMIARAFNGASWKDLEKMSPIALSVAAERFKRFAEEVEGGSFEKLTEEVAIQVWAKVVMTEDQTNG